MGNNAEIQNGTRRCLYVTIALHQQATLTNCTRRVARRELEPVASGIAINRALCPMLAAPLLAVDIGPCCQTPPTETSF